MTYLSTFQLHQHLPVAPSITEEYFKKKEGPGMYLGIYTMLGRITIVIVTYTRGHKWASYIAGHRRGAGLVRGASCKEKEVGLTYLIHFPKQVTSRYLARRNLMSYFLRGAWKAFQFSPGCTLLASTMSWLRDLKASR